MTGWLPMLALAGAVAAFLWHGLGTAGRQLVLAALLCACAGYAWQGRPGLEGARPSAAARVPTGPSAFETLRGTMMGEVGPTSALLAAADAFHRRGRDDYAVAVLRGAVNRSPNDVELQTGLATAITFYADGLVTPAATLAFERAAVISPEHPAPPFFHGLALAQAGRMDEAEALWRPLLARTPARAPWRPQIERSLRLLELIRESA